MRRYTAIALVLCLLCALTGCATNGTGGADTTTALDDSASGATNATAAGATSDATASAGATAFETTLNATVVDVADGDTVDVRLANGTEETIRLVGVDTPEVWVVNTPRAFRGMANTSANRDCLRGWGHNASDYTRTRLAGANVTLAFDPNTDRRGYYGRLLAYVYVNGTNYNAALVERGLARVYDGSDFSRKTAFQRAETAAYENRTGLWTCVTDGGGSVTHGDAGTTVSDGVVMTSDRESTTGATDGGSLTSENDAERTTPVAVDIHADAAGPDGENLNDEYVVLRNTGDATIDLGGARVIDAAGHEYVFSDGTTLAPGASLTLHTGTGTNGDGDYYWDAGRPIWNNDGDTVTVRAANGTTIARYTDG